MAKIGLKNFKYSVLDDEDKVTTPESLGRAVNCQVSIDTNSAELYADDALAESDYTFQKGKITLEVDDDADKTFAKLLGHTISSSGDNVDEVICNANDVAPYVAVGRILTKVVKGVYQYKVEVLLKVKFKEPNADESTKGESVEFGTSSIEGTVLQLANGEWQRHKTFSDYASAETYLNNLLTAKA